MGLRGINWHKLYSCVRIRSGRRLGSEVVGFASFRGEADRRRGRVNHTLEFRLCANAQVAIAHGKEKVRPVAVSAYSCAINAESRWRRCNVEGNIVGPGCANHVYQRLASVGLCRWVLLPVRLHIKVNFIRAAAGGRESVRRGILSNSGRSKQQRNQGSPEHAGASFKWLVLCIGRA